MKNSQFFNRKSAKLFRFVVIGDLWRFSEAPFASCLGIADEAEEDDSEEEEEKREGQNDVSN